ncbi:hypothetical protein UFOVP1229_107 [uncultured Caudovirales phage]|uniref:Uncharacterized protein n=1 Tax=uncultured Caudovirales phage TaxID=2100421 RepID=A0A6J5R4P0_9CAUD|nr:hypothetical protein UFOVP1229_107 [uncultured Caudovirales phage]
MSEELQATINALNARTAAYDVQIVELQQQITQLKSDIVAEKESSATALHESEEKRVADLATAKSESDAAFNQMSAKAQDVINQISRLNKALDERWQAQNTYVIALENQSVGEVRAALIAFRDAETRVQIEALSAKLNANG